jgi:flagellar biogenesis protein FliO
MEPLILLKSLALIILFLALIYGLFIITKKRNTSANISRRLGVLEYQRIDHKNSVCLLRSDNHEFLIAMGPSTIAIYPISNRE